MQRSNEEVLKKFFKDLVLGPPNFPVRPFDNDLRLKPTPPIPWLTIELPNFPGAQIYAEALAVKDRFVFHRADQGHQGWKALCLHGISEEKTDCFEDYGYDDESKVHYQWTEVAKKCPITVDYFKTQFPSDGYRRIRFMLVKKKGYILPHRDREETSLGPLSICLNSPEDCDFGLQGHGIIPTQAGLGYLIDISNNHSVWNRSEEDRFHIIVEINPGKQYKKYLQIILQSLKKDTSLPIEYKEKHLFFNFV